MNFTNFVRLGQPLSQWITTNLFFFKQDFHIKFWASSMGVSSMWHSFNVLHKLQARRWPLQTQQTKHTKKHQGKSLISNGKANSEKAVQNMRQPDDLYNKDNLCCQWQGITILGFFSLTSWYTWGWPTNSKVQTIPVCLQLLTYKYTQWDLLSLTLSFKNYLLGIVLS